MSGESRPVRVDLVAPPMAGHLHPVLGIAVRLAAEPDLAVRVVSTPGAAGVIAAAGVPGTALLAGADETLETVVNPPYRIGGNPRLLLRQFRAAMALQQRFRTELLADWGSAPPDLVIADFTLPAVGTAAQAVGVPWWTSHPSPCAIEGRSGPPAYCGGWRPGRTTLGRARDTAGRVAVRGFKRAAPRVAGVRLADLGASAVYRPDGTEAVYSPELVLALTPEAIEYPRTLPPSVRHVGPVLYTPPTGTPPLTLRAGRRHVLLTAGTHLPWHKQDLVDAARRAAVALPGVDLHVTLGGQHPHAALPSRTDAPENLFLHDVVDYAADLPRFDAVVHHGGSGVLGHTLAAGLPAVVWPVDYDQADHAVRLVDAGVALRLRRADELAGLLRRVLDEPSYAAAARAVAAQVAARPAVETITALLRHRLAPHRP
ncbi:glycosyltransferase family 1 protein [Nocardioides sp. zg-ZUI104]|uniref:nucleotide disphospho-sugar-binding domain-containing protein n=1 Tax=Nocardioides faecalis TaxID=2803858 RepID=UPI001BD0FD59|nr:glycosyltransferase [Nocardioides faecalis]MBS4751883.1 glycosyltransferase family 1 protein [Nocardioides faecalis]